MLRVSRYTFVLCAVAMAGAIAGCGGDDDSASAEPPTATAPQQQNERLTPAAWEEYTKVRDEARSANAEATVTFKKCRKSIYESDEAANAEECFGDSLTNLTSVGKSTVTFLEGQQAEVSGACAKANTELTGYIQLYTASAQSLSSSVDTTNPATIDNALVALNRARAAQVAFVAACKPTASS